MAYGDEPDRRRKIASAGLSAGMIGLVAFATTLGPGIAASPLVQDTMTTINLEPVVIPPPPTPEPAPKKATPEPEGAAAPPAKRATPSPVVRPKPKVDLKKKNAIRAADKPDKGADNSAGAAPINGPGTGAGGVGDGRGSGRFGSGTGGGGGIRPPVKIAGTISNKDYPKALRKARIGGTVIAWYTVGTDGRTSNCRITQSSGNGELDALTCRLIIERYRYRPATGPDGQPVTDKTGWKQRWWVEGRGETDPDTDRD